MRHIRVWVYLYIGVGFLHAVCSDCIGNAKTSDSGMDSGRKNPRFFHLC